MYGKVLMLRVISQKFRELKLYCIPLLLTILRNNPRARSRFPLKICQNINRSITIEAGRRQEV